MVPALSWIDLLRSGTLFWKSSSCCENSSTGEAGEDCRSAGVFGLYNTGRKHDESGKRGHRRRREPQCPKDRYGFHHGVPPSTRFCQELISNRNSDASGAVCLPQRRLATGRRLPFSSGPNRVLWAQVRDFDRPWAGFGNDGLFRHALWTGRGAKAAALLLLLAGLAACASTTPQPQPAVSAAAAPPPPPSPPPIDLAGKWRLSAAGGGACQMTFGDAPGAAQGTIAPAGGCPGNFFTSRKWTFEHGIADHPRP